MTGRERLEAIPKGMEGDIGWKSADALNSFHDIAKKLVHKGISIDCAVEALSEAYEAVFIEIEARIKGVWGDDGIIY
jgi:hypothetical protein